MALAAIRLALPIRQLLFVLSDDLDTVVGASTVDDDVLKVRVVLFQNGEDGLFQALPWLKEGVTMDIFGRLATGTS